MHQMAKTRLLGKQNARWLSPQTPSQTGLVQSLKQHISQFIVPDYDTVPYAYVAALEISRFMSSFIYK